MTVAVAPAHAPAKKRCNGVKGVYSSTIMRWEYPRKAANCVAE